MSRKQKALLIIVLLCLLLGVVFWVASAALNAAQEVSTSEFVQLIENGQVTNVQIEGNIITGVRTVGGGKVSTTADRTMSVVIEALNAREGEDAIIYDEDGSSNNGQLFSIVMNVFFLAFIIFIVYMLYRGMKGGLGGGGGGGMFGAGGFTQDKSQRIDGKSGKTFADVGGIDEAVAEVREIVDYLHNPTKYQKLGGRMPNGALLMGPPGVGKTLLARATAGEAGVPFYSVSGADFNEMFVGVGAARVRSLFEKAKKEGQCIIFIDELDSIGRKRGVSFSGGEKESENTLNSLLSLMDGVDPSTGLVFMGATNQPDQLDPALMRPGRFDRQIHVPLPDITGREMILGIHIRNNGVPLADDVDIPLIAQITPGMSGADLENLVNEAAIVAARQGLDAVDLLSFSEASDKVLMGLARKSMAMTEEEKSITCVHEIGHVICGHMSQYHDPVQKVTCIPRGPALGVTLSAPEFDRHMHSREFILARITMSLGGRAAEEVIVGKISTGASSDLDNARRLAWAMATRYAMIPELGQLSLGRNGQSYLGGDAHEAQYSEETARKIDEHVKSICDKCYEDAKLFISGNKDKVMAASRALFEKETLVQSDLNRLLGERPKSPPPFSLNM